LSRWSLPRRGSTCTFAAAASFASFAASFALLPEHGRQLRQELARKRR